MGDDVVARILAMRVIAVVGCSPKPERPISVCGCAPMASPRRRSSANPRVTNAACALAPSPLPAESQATSMRDLAERFVASARGV